MTWTDTFLPPVEAENAAIAEAARVLDVASLPVTAVEVVPLPAGEAPFRPVAVGKLAFGQGPLWLPVAGYQGDHLVVAGTTGGGKSGVLQAYTAQLAHRPWVSLWMSDPKLVELGPPWAHSPDRPGRATCVAYGPEEATKLLDLAVAEIRWRYEWMRDHRVRLLPTGHPDHIDPRTGGPFAWCVFIFDELQEITDGDDSGNNARKRTLRSGLALGRACGVGFVLCTQSPDFQTVPKRITRNCGCHVLLRTGDAYHDKIVAGRDMGAYDMTRPGEMKVSHRGVELHGRAAWVPDDELYRVNDRTAGLRVAYPGVPAVIDIEM